MKLKLVVVTPEKKVVDAEADEIELPGELGYLGILPGHAPLITLLKTGVLSYRNAASGNALALASGFAEVSSDVVTVLADRAEEAGDIDPAAATRDRQKAEEELKTAGVETVPEITARLQMAEARLAVARRGTAQS